MRSMNLKTKLIILVVVLLSFTVVVGIIGNQAQHKITTEYSKIEKDNVPQITALYEAMIAMRTARTYVSQLALPNLSAGDAKDLKDRINNALKTYEDEDKNYRSVPFGVGEEDMYKPLNDSATALKDDIKKAIELNEKAGGKEGPSMEAMRKIIAEDLTDDSKTQQQQFFMMMDWQKKDITNVATVANEVSKKGNLWSAISISSAILLGLILAFIIMKNIMADQEKTAQAMADAMRSFNMVEKSPINTMMATPDCEITYKNATAKATIEKLQVNLSDNVEALLSKNIERDPKKLPQKNLISIGNEKLDFLTAAIFDNDGKYLGPMITFEIVTDKVNLVRDLTNASNDLAGAATNVMSISSNLSAAAEETSAQANTASVASEEVNSGVQSVANNMGEMTSAIKEITKTTGEAASMTHEAMGLAKNANLIINKLGESSIDIGNVIKVISSIAQQTNLLALNATIEAARAGEAGKGFAVVANEVKELAKQTAKATGEITQKIETIQSDSQNAVNAIADISHAIEKVNGFTANIAAAVEEQAATTNEVTRVVTEAAEGVKQISENIIQVSQAAANTGKDAGNAQGAAKGVGETAELLKKYVARLKV